MSEDWSYVETATMDDGGSDSMSVAENIPVIPADRRLVDKPTSKIYYKDEFSEAGFSPTYPFSAKDMKLVNIANVSHMKPIKLDGKEYAIVDLFRNNKLYEVALKKYLGGSALKDFERKILDFYDKKNWQYALISTSDIAEVLEEYGVALPISTPSQTTLRAADTEWAIELEIARLLPDTTLTPSEIASRCGVDLVRVHEVYKSLRVNKCLPCEKKPQRGTRKNGKMPTYGQVEKLLRVAYKTQGHISKGWRGFVHLMKQNFPQLSGTSPKTIENQARVRYKLRSMKPSRKPYGRSVEEVIEIELVQASLMLSLLKEHDILFFDQTTFSFDTSDLSFIGDSTFRPKFSMGKPKAPLHMMCCMLPSGPYAIQFSYQSATSDTATYFLSSVCAKYREETGLDGCVVYLDNAPYQKTAGFHKAMRAVSASLVYGIPNSPFLNLVEDFFLGVKRRIKQADPMNHDEYKAAIPSAIVGASADCSWILKKFLDKVLKQLQEYRLSKGDPDVPVDLKKFFKGATNKFLRVPK